MADDELYLPDIENVSGGEPVRKREHLNDGEKKKGRHGKPEGRESRDNFAQLARAAETANHNLKEKNLPYRVSLTQKDGEVFIDIVVLNPDGTVAKTIEKNISADKFYVWLEHITSGEGLFLDNTG
jgi:hypothetical protein